MIINAVAGVFVKHIALIALVLAVVVLCAPVAAFASVSDRPSEIAPPVVDTFEDGDCRLRLIALPSADLSTTQVTLVYEDRALRTVRALTVNPDVVASASDPKFDAFLASMDVDFVSYVRATLADRLLHLSSTVSILDRVGSALFFRSTDVGTRFARRVSATESAAE